jgi:hypothetical protein
VDVFLKLNTGESLGFRAGAWPAALERLRASANVARYA